MNNIYQNILLILVLALGPLTSHSKTENSGWVEKLSQFQNQIYAADSADKISQTLEDLWRLEQNAITKEKVYISIRVFELCKIAFKYGCANKAYARFVSANQKYFDELPVGSIDRDFNISQNVELTTRYLLFFQNYEGLEKQLQLLERITKSTFQSADFSQANLTLAHGYMQLGEMEKAIDYLQRSWLYFICDHGMSREKLLTLVPEYFELFRDTGQMQRARSALLILEVALDNFALENKYGALWYYSARIAYFSDIGDFKTALQEIEKTEKLLEIVPFSENIKSFYKTRLASEYVIMCSTLDPKSCRNINIQILHNANEAFLKSTNDRGNEQAIVLSALALTYNRILKGEKSDTVSQEIANKLEVNTLDTFAGRSEAIPLLALKAFVEIGDGKSPNSGLMLQLTKKEVARLAKYSQFTPFETAPISSYSRIILELGSLSISAGANLTENELETLLDAAELNNQSPRSIESKYIYLLSFLNNEEERTSFRTMHRLEQRLFELEKEALFELVQVTKGVSKNPLGLNAKKWVQIYTVHGLWTSHLPVRLKALKFSEKDGAKLSRLKQNLRSDEKYIQTFSATNRLIRICIGSKSHSIESDQIDGPEDSVALKTVLTAFSAQNTSSLAKTSFPLAALERLSVLILGKDGKCLGESQKVIFGANPSFASLPYTALIDEPGSNFEKDGKLTVGLPWLGSRRAISMVMDSQHFVASRKLKGQVQELRPFLGIADPKLSGVTENGIPRLDAVLRGVRLGTSSLKELEELPETRTEVEAVAKIFGSGSNILVGEQATEINFRGEFLSRYRVISFATHGLLRQELDGITEPALVMTPVNMESSMNDGLLTASEISQLEFNADLIILSACNSANFEPQLFGPEIAGLSSAFFLAGAKATLATLWSVDSEATTEFVTDLVKKMVAQGSSPSEALREIVAYWTQKKDSSFDYLHPSFWAAFSIYGDGLTKFTSPHQINQAQEIYSKRTAKVPGELLAANGFGRDNSFIVTGYKDVGTSRVAGQVMLVKKGKEEWVKLDNANSFEIFRTRGLQAKTPTILAWRSENDILKLAVRRYREDGALIFDREISSKFQEIFGNAIELPSGELIVLTTTSDKNGYLSHIRSYTSSGALQYQFASHTVGLSQTKIFHSPKGIWLTIDELKKSTGKPLMISSLGAIIYCSSKTATRLINLNNKLIQTGAELILDNLRILDLKPYNAEEDVVALTESDPCQSNPDIDQAGIAFLSSDGIGKKSMTQNVGFSNRARSLLVDGKQIILISSLEQAMDGFVASKESGSRIVDMSQSLVQATRPVGVLISKFDKAGNQISSTRLFNGGVLYASDAVISAGELVIVGSNNFYQFFGGQSLHKH